LNIYFDKVNIVIFTDCNAQASLAVEKTQMVSYLLVSK